jgi:hypothetical protein
MASFVANRTLAPEDDLGRLMLAMERPRALELDLAPALTLYPIGSHFAFSGLMVLSS